MPLLRRYLASSVLIRASRPKRAFLPPVSVGTVPSRTMAKEYKVKDCSGLNLKDGEMQQYDLEGIEGGQVLLAHTKGHVHAISPKCTHYGAPLSKGVLSPAGTIRCPWHGACFNVTTGDVEDAPALHHLNKYDVYEKDGAVYVRAEESALKTGMRKASIKCSASGSDRIIVVGGGSGTVGLIHGLRERHSTMPVLVIHKEPNLPIDRPKLSKALIDDANKILLHDQDFYKEGGVTFAQDEVKSIDFAKKRVSTASGESYTYSKLVLATGGTPKSLPLPGFKDLKNIFPMRSIPDVKEIVAAVGEKKGRKVVVAGSGFIGLEVANALAADNTVTVVDMLDVPLKAVLGVDVGKGIQKLYEAKGVKFYMNAGIEKAAPAENDNTAVGSVHLKDGTSIPADFVVSGVGVGPATEYLRDNSSIKLDKDGGITVDRHYAVSGVEGVYAIGDIARFPYDGPTGKGDLTRIEHWNVAQNQGRAVGHQLAGTKDTKQHFPVFWSAVTAQLRYCGNTPNGWDGVHVDGNPAEGKFAAYYAKGGEVAAVATMGRDPIMVKAVDLMERGKMPGLKELEGGKVDVLAL